MLAFAVESYSPLLPGRINRYRFAREPQLLAA
jgi:hypothetical protein